MSMDSHPWGTDMFRKILIALLVMAIPGAQAIAQPLEVSRWSVQPSVGVLLDAYDMRPDGSRAGALAGLEISRRFTEPATETASAVRGLASFAYARVSDVGGRPPVEDGAYRVYRNEWMFATVGAGVDLPVRRATVSLSLQVGGAWRRTPDVRLVGTPSVEDQGPFGPPTWLRSSSGETMATGVLVPAIAVGVPISRGLAVVGGARGYWTGFDEGGDVSPAFTLGMSWAP